MARPAATLQFCTYNRARLLERVLLGCFEQTTGDYEIVLVDDGSSDDTQDVIRRLQPQAPVPFHVITQQNSGLARARNAGIARAQGERIIFIDDDVLPMPNFVARHVATGRRHGDVIVRGAVIMTESFDRLPPPIWSLKDYSGNFFWTSNVSIPLDTLRRFGSFSERFHEYGWEDIELGLRLRKGGIRGRFDREAVAFHYKPPIRASRVEAMIAQARAQARTAVELATMHRSWRVMLATGDDPLQRAFERFRRTRGNQQKLADRLPSLDEDRPLSAQELRTARALARTAYYAELEAAHERASSA